MNAVKKFRILVQVNVQYNYEYFVEAPDEWDAFERLTEEKFSNKEFMNDRVHSKVFSDDYLFVECEEVSEIPAEKE